MAKKVTIFLASSSELSRERQYIGNRVRMLNDEWEPHGFRIVLNTWEDYAPEFTGERQQTNYNLHLVDRSDIVFGLFRKTCGKYTQEEVLRGQRNNQNKLHCFKLPSDNNSAVQAFEISSGIPIKEAEGIEEVWKRIRKSIEEFIETLSIPTTNCTQLMREKIYATIGLDLQEEEDSLGNMLRGLDDFVERQMGIRCLLLPLHIKSKIVESDYYLAMLNNVLDEQSLAEFKVAYHGLMRSKRPTVIAPFQKRGGVVTRYDAENEVSSLMCREGKEFFPIEFESLDTIKITLLAYLLRKVKVLSPQSIFTMGESDSLYFGSRKITDSIKAIGLSSRQENMFGVQTELLQLMMPLVPKLGVESNLREEIRDLLSTNDDLTNKEAIELVDKCTNLISFLKKNVGKFYQPDYILRMMLLRIACNDRFSELIGNTPNVYYKEFVEYADRYSFVDILVEEMRINYANSFARGGKEDEAMHLYGEARRNLRQLGINIKVIRTQLFLLYYNALAVLATTRQENELKQWTDELEALSEQWIREDNTLTYFRCYPIAFRIDVLNVDELADVHLIAKAEDWWRKMKELSNGDIEDRVSFLVGFHALTKSLSRYYVDRISINGLELSVRMAYAKKAEYYLDCEETLCQELTVYNRDEALKLYAALLHNRGFMLKKTVKDDEAFMSYLKSLDLRKQLFSMLPNVNREDDIAETMVNIGALLLETTGQFFSDNSEIKTDALYYAERALEIYTRHNDGTLYHSTNEYKAKLLKGTILYYKGSDRHQKEEGIRILQEVKHWDEENPDNYYHSTIIEELLNCPELTEESV